MVNNPGDNVTYSVKIWIVAQDTVEIKKLLTFYEHLMQRLPYNIPTHEKWQFQAS